MSDNGIAMVPSMAGDATSPAADSFNGRILAKLEQLLDTVAELSAWRDSFEDDDDADWIEERPAQTPPPAAHRHRVESPIDIAALAHKPVEEWQRQIGARHGCNASSVRDALLRSPHFAHWRQIAQSRQCPAECRACGSGTSITGCRAMLRLLAQTWDGYATRYDAIMAGDESAALRAS